LICSGRVQKNWLETAFVQRVRERVNAFWEFLLNEILHHGFETLSAPASIAATLRGFTFCVAAPAAPFDRPAFSDDSTAIVSPAFTKATVRQGEANPPW